MRQLLDSRLAGSDGERVHIDPGRVCKPWRDENAVAVVHTA